MSARDPYAESKRNYRTNMAGKQCGCGKPAIKFIGGGFTCLACLALDRFVEGMHRKTLTAQRHSEGHDADRAEALRLYFWKHARDKRRAQSTP